jgi:hypothetical protein
MNISSGYGFGLWLVPQCPYLKENINHIPHITLICNLSLSSATNLYHSIEEHFRYNIPSFTMNITGENTQATIFPIGEYSSNSNYLTQHSWGYYCDTDDHQLRLTNQLIRDFSIDNHFIGSIPSKPHLTVQYSNHIDSLSLYQCPSDIMSPITCTMKLVDITSGDSSNWTLLN